MKVKIVMCQTLQGDEYSEEIIRHGITDWEEISEEDYKLLRENMHRIVKHTHYGYTPWLVIQDTKPVTERLEGIKEALKKELKIIEQEKKERENKKKEKEKKKQLKTEEEQRKLFEQLKEKFKA